MWSHNLARIRYMVTLGPILQTPNRASLSVKPSGSNCFGCTVRDVVVKTSTRIRGLNPACQCVRNLHARTLHSLSRHRVFMLLGSDPSPQLQDPKQIKRHFKPQQNPNALRVKLFINGYRTLKYYRDSYRSLYRRKPLREPLV